MAAWRKATIPDLLRRRKLCRDCLRPMFGVIIHAPGRELGLQIPWCTCKEHGSVLWERYYPKDDLEEEDAE